MLTELSNLNGVSGDEGLVRQYLIEKLANAAVEYNVDTMGNLLVRKGSANRNRIMLAAHMDEVGLMITGIEKSGLLKFSPVGGLDSRILPGKRLQIGRNRLPGVIGAKAIHLQKKSEQNNPFDLESLLIDAGFKGKEEAEKNIKLGDYAAFTSTCTILGDGVFRGKAFDDRAGCLVLLNLLLEDNGLSFDAAFTVQEEIGTRGATVAAYTLKPQRALVVEATAAADTPETEKAATGTMLGKGAAISIMDRTLLVSRKMREELAEIAEQHAIPYQYRRFTGAGTEGGAISTSREGVETAVVSVPCRYIHSPHSLIDESDINSVLNLVRSWLEKSVIKE